MSIILAQLDMHEKRRQQVLPVISTLIGDPFHITQQWSTWEQQHNRSTVYWSPWHRQEMLATWLYTCLQHRTTQPHLDDRLYGDDACTMHPPIYPDDPVLQDIVRELAQLPPTKTLDVATLHAMLASIRAQHALSDTRLLQYLMSSMPSTLPPALLVTLTTPVSHISTQVSIAQWLSKLARLAEAIPTLTLAVAIQDEEVNTWLHTQPESRYKAMLREGLIQIPKTGVSKPKDTNISPLPTALEGILQRYHGH